jgi:hypothetical protein
MRASFLVVALAFGFYACDSEQAQFDEMGPVIEVRQPAIGQSFTGSAEMDVEVVLSENLGLHTYFIWLVEAESGMPHLVDKNHLHTRVHTVVKTVPLDGLPKGAYELLVTATDHDQNTSEMRVPLILE